MSAVLTAPSKGKTESSAGGQRTVILVAGRRTLCLIGTDTDDKIIEVPHDAVADVTVKTGLCAHRLALRTPRKMYHCWIHRKTDKSLRREAADFISDRQQRDPDAIDGDDDASRVMYRGRPVAADDTAAGSDSDQTVYSRGQPVDEE